jgi:hypothetical protein
MGRPLGKRDEKKERKKKFTPLFHLFRLFLEDVCGDNDSQITAKTLSDNTLITTQNTITPRLEKR